MSTRKTALDRAIEQLDAEIAVLHAARQRLIDQRTAQQEAAARKKSAPPSTTLLPED